MANKLVEGAAETFDAVLENLGKVTDTYLDLEKIIPGVSDLFIDQAKDIRVLNKELGNSSKLTAGFRGEIAKLSRDLGVSARDTIELVKSTKEYHQGITQSTEATLKFSKASGVSTSVIGKFTAKLNIMGHTSSEVHEKMYENILAVREAYGLTDTQIDNITDTLTNYAIATQASDTQMEKASVTLSKFTSMLTSAGIESERVADILNDMINPDRMMDNLVLMSKMGISINDMVSGDPMTKLEGSVDKLKQVGEEIANIAKTNRFQANEIAKVYGLTLNEAIQLSEMDTSEKALNTQKKLDEYRNETATLVESLEAFKDRLSGGIAMILNPILKGFEKLEGVLGLFNKGLVATVMMIGGKWLINKLREGIGNLFGEAAKKFAKTAMGEYLNQVEGRSKLKAGDMSKLKVESQKQINQNYGFGWNFGVRAGARRERASQRLFGNTNPNRRGLDAGEIVTTLQAQQDDLNKLLMQFSKLKENSAERNAFISKYGSGDDIKNRISSISNYIETFGLNGFGTNLTDKINTFNKSSTKGAAKQNVANEILSMFNKASGSSLKVDEKDAVKAAQIISESKNIREALENLSTFFETKNMPEQVEALQNSLKNLDEQIVNNYKQNRQAQFDLERNEKIIGGKGTNIGFFRGIGNRAIAIGKGLKDNIVSGFMNVISGFKNIIKGIPKLLGISILAGVGAKFMTSLSKNEKFQESISNITERIGTIFDGLVKAIEPIIEPLSKAVIGIFNFIQPAIDWLSRVIGKIANWVGGKLEKYTSSINTNVSSISDSYKQEDLKTMLKADWARYDTSSDSIVAALGEVTYIAKDISTQIKIGNDAVIAKKQ